MLDFLVSWAEQLIITLIIIVIIEMILPQESSYRKYIKVILGVFLIYTIISPILSNKLNNIEFTQILAVENQTTQNVTNSINYDKQIKETYAGKLEENMAEFLKQNGYELIKFDTNLDYTNGQIEILKMDLSVKKINSGKTVVIDKVKIKQDEKIDSHELDEIKEKIANYYDIEVSKISVSESEK